MPLGVRCVAPGQEWEQDRILKFARASGGMTGTGSERKGFHTRNRLAWQFSAWPCRGGFIADASRSRDDVRHEGSFCARGQRSRNDEI